MTPPKPIAVAARLPALAALLALGACSLASGMPDQSPPLRDMEEPLDLRVEPDDEAARRTLPLGTFSGLYLVDSRETLAEKLDAPASVEVERVVENSPAARAGLQPGDLVLEAEVGGDAVELRRPSEWRKLELESQPGTTVVLFVDRAGREARTELTLEPRLRAPDRALTERYREEQRAGVIVRSATEVEARTAGLGPGGGAVLVGMSARSPWRKAGLRFGDLIVAVDGAPLSHPQDLLLAARDDDRDALELTFVRGGARDTVTAALTRREHEMTEVTVPLLFSYESDRGASEWSMLLGLLAYRETAAAWRFRLLWLFGFGGGDADQLLESGS